MILMITLSMKIRYFVLLLFFVLHLHGDVLKENYLTFELNGTSPRLLVDFESDNLEKFIRLDDNGNGIVSWKELRAHRAAIEHFVLEHLLVTADGKKCTPKVDSYDVYRRIHQSYIRLWLRLVCEVPEEKIGLKYTLFFDVDKDQKAFVRIGDANGTNPEVLSSRREEVTLQLQKPSALRAFSAFLKEGIWHIWIGYDHILFLLMLLVPSVYRYRGREPVPREGFRDVFVEILKIVTAFSVAHSLTLGLSVTGVVTLNPTLVEVAIAISVLLTALNNLWPVVRSHAWVAAFGFGLIHGFGFANVLHEMVLQKKDFLSLLFGFNLGVEIGQLVIVTALLPLLYGLRKTRLYRYGVLYGFSAVTALIALLWAIERYFGMSLLLF